MSWKLTVIRKASVKCRRDQTWSGSAKPEVVVYFGLLLFKSKVGVAKSRNWVAAIFLLPVWPLAPSECSLLPYSASYRRLIAHRRLEMLSIRTSGAQNLNLGPEVQFRNRKYFQKCPKWSEMPWNLFLSEKCEKSRRRQTESISVLWATFGQIGIRGHWVRKTGRRHISTSGSASRATRMLFSALFSPVSLRYRT